MALMVKKSSHCIFGSVFNRHDWEKLADGEAPS